MLNKLRINSSVVFMLALLVTLFLSVNVDAVQFKTKKDNNLTPAEQSSIYNVPSGAFNPADLVNDHWFVTTSLKDPQGRLWGFAVNTKPNATISHSLAIFESLDGSPPSVVVYLEGNKLRFLHMTPDHVTYEWDPSIDKKTYDTIAKLFIKAWPVLGHVLIKGDSI